MGLFEFVYVVKPYLSRTVNSERYLVAKHCRTISSVRFTFWKEHLEAIHAYHTDDSVMISLVPQRLLVEDATFHASVLALNNTLATRQTSALSLVMERVFSELGSDDLNPRVLPRIQHEHSPSSSSSSSSVSSSSSSSSNSSYDLPPQSKKKRRRKRSHRHRRSRNTRRGRGRHAEDLSQKRPKLL